MTVDQLLENLGAAFPAFNARALEAWAPVFRARLGRHEGAVLAKAYADTLGNFTVTASKALFPMPADFDAYLPSSKIDMGREHGKKLDLEGRKRRADSLFADWQAGQCRRADKGNQLLRTALENIARQVADVMGWKENPAPLILTSAQLKTACQSALSLERRLRFGQPPKDKYIWWQQITAIAEEWSIRDAGQPITPEWWDKTTGEAFKPGADDEPAPVSRVAAATLTRATPAAPRDPAAHLALLKARIRFFRDMGMVDYVAAMERELATLEPPA